MSFAFHNPVRIRFGRGCRSELSGRIERPALIVAGPTTLARSGLADLGDEAGGIHVFDAVTPNPTPGVIDEGARRAVAAAARTIVGIGGGSALDAARCIAVMIGNTTRVRDLFDPRGRANESLARQVRLVQVPTTAGTGSEVTRWASVWDEQGKKWSVDVACGYADEALVDPSLTDSMGPRLTAATGLDALAHAIESLWNVHSNPISDQYAVEAIRLIRRHLRPAISGGSVCDRDGMALAACLAGLGLSNCRSAAAHALSYTMTGRYGVEHGLAVGILCRALFPFTARVAPERVGVILAALGAETVGAATEFIDDVLRTAGVEPTLRALGVAGDAFPAIVDTALSSDRLANHPGDPDREVLLEALRGIA